MTSTTALIAAAADADLLARAVAIVEARGLSSAGLAAQMGHLVAQPVQDDQCIADVHAYATLTREQALAAVPPPVGTNLAAVTDAQLVSALTSLGVIPAVDKES